MGHSEIAKLLLRNTALRNFSASIQSVSVSVYPWLNWRAFSV